MTWSTFADAAPALAAEGRRLMFRGETGEVLLATVRGDDPPRIHPIYVELVDDRLYAFILSGPKRRDLERDGRYALHTHVDPAEPSEFSLRGRAWIVTDPGRRQHVAERWSFEVDDGYGLFEFDVAAAVLGDRPDADAWPPRYTSWRVTG
jgi:hypothetical protein